MSKQDKIITSCMISIAAVVSLLALPQTTTHIAAEDTPPAINYFADVKLEAKAAYVYDTVTKKELYAKDEKEALPLASITKIMTAVTASELGPQSTVVTIDSDSLKQEGDSGLYANERWNLKKLLQYTLVMSSNDGAAAVASAFGSTDSFIQSMNTTAHRLGLPTLRFYNSSGLDVNENQAGAYGSAEDIAKLMTYALEKHHDVIEPTRYDSYQVQSIDEFNHTAKNTDVIVGEIPGMIAGKTGYTELAGGNLAVIFDAGLQHPITVVVLGSSYNGRFDDVQKLVNASIKEISSGQ